MVKAIRITIIILTYQICLSECMCQIQKNEKLEAYYSFINKAELSIIDSNFRQSIQLYNKAFSQGYSFPIDLSNALLAAFLVKDTISTIKYCNRLAEMGLSKKILNYMLFDQDTMVNNHFFNLVTRSMDDLYISAQKSGMFELAQKQNKIREMDQECRKLYSQNNDSLLRCDECVHKEMLRFIDSFGFPSYKLVGLLEDRVRRPYNHSTIDLLLVHAKGIQKNAPLLKVVLKAVNSGEYNVKNYAYLYDFGVDSLNMSFFKTNFTKSNLEIINKRRAAFMLEPLQDYLRKVYYHSTYRYSTGFVFIPMVNLMTVNYMEATIVIE